MRCAPLRELQPSGWRGPRQTQLPTTFVAGVLQMPQQVCLSVTHLLQYAAYDFYNMPAAALRTCCCCYVHFCQQLA